MTLVLVLALFLAGCFAANLILYAVTWYDHVNFCCTPDEPGWRMDRNYLGAAWGFVMESLAIFLALATWPLHFHFDRNPGMPAPGNRPPVLLVHAWGSASHTFLFIRRALKNLGFTNIYTLTYRPVTRDAAILARKVAYKMDEVLKETGAEQLICITHSMGGVLVRYAIKNLGADGKVKKVITLGGPHMGSRIAVFAPWGRNTLQMTYQSKFTKELAEGGMTPGSAEYVSIWSDFDNMVLPPTSSDLGDGAKNLKVPFHGHVYLVYSPKVLKLIRQELAEV